MTCCNHNCNEGRACPERIARAEAMPPFRPIRYVIGYASVFLRWWDHAAAKRNGHLAAITPREPIDWQAVVIYGAVGIACSAIAYLSYI